MENNEIMINEEFDMVDEHIVADDGNGIGTGAAMLIGAGLAFAVGAAVNLGKKGIAKFKASRAKKKAEEAVTIEEPDQADVETK